MYATYFYNFDYSVHSATLEEAQEMGRKSGFQYKIYKLENKA